MFGCFCLGNFVFVWFFIKETKGRTLESMDVLFGTIDANKRAVDVERAIEVEKGVVQHHEMTPVAAPPAEEVRDEVREEVGTKTD